MNPDTKSEHSFGGQDARMSVEQNDTYQYCRSAQLVSAWRGRFDIPRQNLSISVAAHVSNNAGLEVARIMPETLCLELVQRIDIWPASFKSSPPNEDSDTLIFFPEERDKEVFCNLLTYAICGDFALKATIAKAELLIFTSIQLPGKLHKFQGNIFLWGVFEGQRVGPYHQSEHQLHIQTPIVRLSLSANSCGQRSFDETESPGTISSEHNPLTQAPLVERRGRRLDDAWQHVNSLDPLRQKAECKYCGFVSCHGGISRLKAHLGGGHPKIRLPGCERVPLEVKKIMSDWFHVWACKTKALWAKEIRADTGAHNEEENSHDAVWEERKRDFKDCLSFDFSHGELSHKVPDGKGLNVNVEAWPKVSPEMKGVTPVKVENIKDSISPKTKGVMSSWSKCSSSSKVKEPLVTQAPLVERRGRRLDDAWQHVNLLDPLRQKAECKFCGFVSSHGGISRLKAHLGGGHPKIRLPGCERVPLEVKKVMSDWFHVWAYKTKALWTKEIRGENPHDVVWEVGKGELKECLSFDFSRGEISHKVPGGMGLNMNGEAWPKLSPETKGVMPVQVENIEASISPKTKGVMLNCSKGFSSSKVKVPLAETSAHDEEENPHDAVWEDQKRDLKECLSFDFSHGEISRKLPGGMGLNVNGEAWRKVSLQTKGVAPVQVENIEASISPKTKGVMSNCSKGSSLSKVKEPLVCDGYHLSAETGAHDDEENPHDAICEDRKRDFKGCLSFDFSHGEISHKVPGGKGLNVNGEAWPKVSSETKGVTPIKVENIKASISPKTTGVMSSWSKCSSSFKVKDFLEKRPSAKRGRPLDDAWEHAVPLDESRQATKHKHCRFVPSCDGIARMRAHLGGGDLTMRLEGCPCVRPATKALTMPPTPQQKKYKKQSTIANIETAGGAGPETTGIENEAHWFEQTIDGVHSNTCLKESLQKLIDEKNADLRKMQFEIHSLENRLASMP